MKEALQAILIADDDKMWEAILSGKKQITIREGMRSYLPGKPVLLACPERDACVMADTGVITYTRLGRVSERDLIDDGYANLSEAIIDLKKFYPGISNNTPVTVIRWENVRGKLVDDYKARQEQKD